MAWDFYTPKGDISYGTSLPGSPFDQQQHVLVDNATAPTWSWLLQYVAAKSSNKWVFLGGSAAYAEVATLESTTSATYVALTTAGPSVAIPVAGNYTVTVEATVNTVTSSGVCYMSYDIGGTGAVDADALYYDSGSASANGCSVGRSKAKTGLTAVTLTAKYHADGTNSSSFEKRRMSVVPIAIGG